MLEVIDLGCLRGGRKLFGGLSFSLSPCQLLHVQGANGSGKTSLLRIVSGLARQDAGKVRWYNHDIADVREEYANELLYLGHQPAIKDELTVLENLWVSIRLSGLNPAPDVLKSELEVIGLGRHGNLPARVLSQGQRRRLALARLWLSNKKLWILDEPFTSLDTQAIGLVEVRLEHHLSQGGMVILTTHQRPSVSENFLYTLSFDA